MTQPFWERTGFLAWAIPIVLVVAGLVLLFPAPQQIFREVQIAASPVTAWATVVSVDESARSRSRRGISIRSFTPTVSFDVNGKAVTQTLDAVYDGNVFRVGRDVYVAYCELNPKVVVATSQRYVFLLPLAAGLALLGVGAFAFIRRLFAWIDSS